MPPNQFYFSGKYVLLTYAQSDGLDEWEVVGKLSDLGAECIVGREHHRDGAIHHHVFVDFGRRFQSRSSRIFDVGGYHPNIQPSYGTPEVGYDYCCKEGDIVAGGLHRSDITKSESRVSVSVLGAKWARIADAPDRETFWALCKELDPQRLCCNFNALRAYAEWAYMVQPTVYRTPVGFEFPQDPTSQRDSWVSQSGIGSGIPLLG